MIQAEPFVKRAPEIAEEIMAKAAKLPKSLSSFAKELFSKTAEVKDEKLELPKPITLDDLRKMASRKAVDLPDVGNTPTASSGNVIGDLRKLAGRYESEDSNEVLATAAAIYLHGLEKSSAASSLTRVLTPKLTRGFWGTAKSFIPGTLPSLERKTIKAQMGQRLSKAQMGKAEFEAAIPGTKAYEARAMATGLEAKAKGIGEAEKRRAGAAEKLYGAAPYVAGAIGVPAGVAAFRTPAGKKEKIQVIK